MLNGTTRSVPRALHSLHGSFAIFAISYSDWHTSALKHMNNTRSEVSISFLTLDLYLRQHFWQPAVTLTDSDYVLTLLVAS